MNRPTLAVFRAQFPSEAMGVCQADQKVRTYCNDAQERLLLDPLCPDEGWWGGWITMAMTVGVVNGSAYVTAPREIARLIVMGVCDQPIHIRNGFYEYLKYGDGLQPKTCRIGNCGQVFQSYERDNVPILGSLLSTPQIIRIYVTDVRDVGRRVLLQGRDNNLQTVLTTDPGTGRSAPGEYIVLNSPFVDSVNQYSSLTGIMKDSTWGMVHFYQVDPVTAVEQVLSSMEPSEGQANYRRYLITGIPSVNLCCQSGGALQIHAQGRLDFIPVANENDYLTVPCVPALVEEAMSIRLSRMDTAGAAQQSALHHMRAIALLNGQLDTYQGKVNTAVRVPIFGSQYLTRQPV